MSELLGGIYHQPMLSLTQILPFLLAAVLLTATPGPDNLMVLSMGVSRGRRAGMAFGLGCATGCLSHTVLAVLGVSALVAASPSALLILKWAGGAYLMWLGLQALRHAGKSEVNTGGHAALPARQLFVKGLVANAINPKVVLFFLSFLPQFVDASLEHVERQLGLLGLLFTLQAALLFGLIGYFAGGIGAWLARKPSAAQWLDRMTGVLFFALGARLIIAR